MKRITSVAHALLLTISALTCAVPAVANTVEYVHTDALGSVVAVTDANRVVIERREYEPYGFQLTPALQNGPGYTAHVQDAATGMTYMQQRYYDPVIGRFLSVDPVDADGASGGNFNRYWYANNSPYAFVDPDGRWSAKAHDELIANALKDRIPSADVKVIQQSSRDFDKKTQDPDQSHMHSMAGKEQSPKDAKAMTDEFVGTTMVRAKEASQSGDRVGALKLFGEAMHPVMDSSSPEHTDSNGDPKVWRGIRDAIGHSPTDWIGNETSKDLTPAIVSSQSRRINSAYDWVFGAEKPAE